jgi:peptidoglycan/LPS O-acetylase OafA/YrhL
MFEPVASKERVLFQDYRPDIAGLRAIAVIAATLFHARFQHVARQLYISGYLITRFLLVECPDGTFNLGKYNQRSSVDCQCRVMARG